MKNRTESSARRTGRLRAFVTIVLTIEMCPDVWADEASDIRAGQELLRRGVVTLTDQGARGSYFGCTNGLRR